MLDERPGDRNRRGRSGHAHPDELGRDAGPRRVDEALGRQVAPFQGRGGASVENGHRFGLQGALSAADGREHVHHRAESLDAERPRDEGLFGKAQSEVEAVAVGDGSRDVEGDQSRALEVHVFQGLDKLIEVDEVGRRGLALGLGPVVEERHGRRTRIEMDLVPADREGPAARPVIQGDDRRRRRQAVLDELSPDPRLLRPEVDIRPGAGEQAQRLGVLDEDAVALEEGQSLIDDLFDEGPR